MSKKLLQAAAGNAGDDEALYVDDVFSTYLYEGNDTDTNIVNGINLADEGGLVWIKAREVSTSSHRLIDSEWSLPANQYLDSSSTTAPFSGPVVNTFNTDGFQLDSNWYGNSSDPAYGGDYASWTFRKAEKFFDVVTYTGTGTEQQIPHNLTSAAKFYVVKRTDAAGDWYVATPGLADWNNSYLVLNSTAAKVSLGDAWSTTSGAPATTFGVMDGSTNNISGATYVAYVFAHDAGGFGDDGSESIIKRGSVTLDGAGQGNVNLGYEPQWVMYKRTDGAGNWIISDSMRGWTALPNQGAASLLANSTAVEGAYSPASYPNSTGFLISGSAGQSFIYIAIRRPMKTPESGTEVFDVQQSITTDPNFVTGFNPDMTFSVPSTTADYRYIFSRLTGTGFMETSNTNAESTGGAIKWDYSGGAHNGFTSYYGWNFRRATGFFDVVAWTGTGSYAVRNHNLGAVPELVIQKARTSLSGGNDWFVNTATQYGYLNLTNSFTNFGRSLTSTTFQPVADGNVNWITYLFATVAGVSKVGSYTGTGADLNVDCGFSAGARFILIKRTSGAGDWYVYDSERGIVAGNDPYILANTNAAQVTNTDYIDPLASGFTITSSGGNALNDNGSTYIFLAIA
jgi:hypothetical protein